MPKPRLHPRPRPARRRAAVLAAAGAVSLAAAGTAGAAVTVTVATPSGQPLAGEYVKAMAGTSTAMTGTTGPDGKVVLTPARYTTPGPWTITTTVSRYYGCPQAPDQTPTQAGVADGATLTLTADVPLACPSSVRGTGILPQTGLFDMATATAMALPGGTVDVWLRIPTNATGVTVMAGATPIGGPGNGNSARMTAPAGGYTGPLTVTYTSSGIAGSLAIGSMTSRPVAATTTNPGPIDIEAIVDVSGSMGGTDPNYIRRDALALLTDLMRPGDRLGVTGFDDESKPILPLTSITGTAANAAAIKRTARRGVVNRGGTNYNIGMTDANAALTAAGVDPARQKAIVFLTDGANGSTYENGHVRFALNASGRSWPVCVVQLGRASGFKAEDVALLKRIAGDTGGAYFATAGAARLTDIYRQCFNLVAAQRTLGQKTFTFRPRAGKRFVKRVPRGLAQATFFAGWGNGAYQLTLTDPRGRKHTVRRPGKGVAFRRGATFAFYRVTRPRPGRWTVELRNVRLTKASDQGKISITTPRKR